MHPVALVQQDGRIVGHALRRLVAGDLKGLFDGPSTVQFDATAPMVTLDLSRIADNSALLSILMTCASSWMEAALADPAGGQRWGIYDEAWRLMAHEPLLRRMDSQWRLARHFGISNVLIFHKLTDLDNVGDHGSAARALASSLLANAETRVIYRQETDQLGPTAQALALTGTEAALLPGLGLGQGLWRIKERSFVVQHQLHPDEVELYNTAGRMWFFPSLPRAAGGRLLRRAKPEVLASARSVRRHREHGEDAVVALARKQAWRLLRITGVVGVGIERADAPDGFALLDRFAGAVRVSVFDLTARSGWGRIGHYGLTITGVG